MPDDRSTDRRVRRTQGLLHGALASLIHEKSYDAIVVKEILARADVGRSTFYSHYRDKDELLDSGIRDMLRACAANAPTRSGDPAERTVRFSLPLFAHLEHYRDTAGSSADVERQARVHEHLERALAELIADELGRAGRRQPQRRADDVPTDLVARHVASTFVLVLNWWMESGEPLPARRANDVFRALVLPALTAAVGS